MWGGFWIFRHIARKHKKQQGGTGGGIAGGALVLCLIACIPFYFLGRSVMNVDTPVVMKTTAHISALNPAWSEFQQSCIHGPAVGQGSTPQACRCWETSLQAAQITPDDAVGVLDAAQVGGGAAYTVLPNIGTVAIRQAANGCSLYSEGAGE